MPSLRLPVVPDTLDTTTGLPPQVLGPPRRLFDTYATPSTRQNERIV